MWTLSSKHSLSYCAQRIYPRAWNFLGCNFCTEGDIAREKPNQVYYDIVIAGGGLVGTTLACAISKTSALSNKRVLLLEASPERKVFNCGEYSNRVSALNNGSIKLLNSIGAWKNISDARYKPVKQMQVWDGISDALITFNHENFCDEVAYIIENDLILDAVYKELKKCRNVEVRNLSKIKRIELTKNGAEKNVIYLEGGDTFASELLIGADGVNSLVRKEMGIETYATPYKQLGLVATVELCDAGDNSVAWQRFIPTGPVALLPLSNNLSSLVWTTTPDHAQKLKKMPAQEFVDALNEAFLKEYPKDNLVTNMKQLANSFFGGYTRTVQQYPPRVKNVLDESRACFPLGFMHATSYVARGVALVGDAAHRIHPLAGQGVNLGFGDVKCLTEKLAEANYSGFKLGQKQHLLKYENERLRKNLPIMLGVHGLQRIYDTSFTPVVLLRSFGLQITQNLQPLKKMFMQHAMG